MEKQHAHLKQVAAQGGAVGGVRRMASMTAHERWRFALSGALNMKRNLGVDFYIWAAHCVFRGKDYTVMGCSAEPENQFRKEVRRFPNGTVVKHIKLSKTIAAPAYVKAWDKAHATGKVANWNTKPAAVVAVQDKFWPKGFKGSRISAAEVMAWTTPRKGGRPRKQ